MYKVIKFFTDLHDNDHPYSEGDTFPRDGVDVSESRLEELAGENNKHGVPLIEFVEVDTESGVEESPKKNTRKTATK